MFYPEDTLPPTISNWIRKKLFKFFFFNRCLMAHYCNHYNSHTGRLKKKGNLESVHALKHPGNTALFSLKK